MSIKVRQSLKFYRDDDDDDDDDAEDANNGALRMKAILGWCCA
jgi:hypothetical protein